MRRTSVITNFIDVFSHHMRDTLRGVSFVGLISMPIKLDYAKARAAFSDCFSICYIQRAVEDKTTVLIYYKSRLAKLAAGRELRNLGARRSSKPSGRRSKHSSAQNSDCGSLSSGRIRIK